MRILVIDDKAANLANAKEQLGTEHDLTLASSYAEAEQLITQSEYGHWYTEGESKFDVVLTDLFLPEHKEGVASTSLTGKEQPYGLIFAMCAIRRGVKMVAIVTFGGHHNSPLHWALDMIGYSGKNVLQLGSSKFICGSYCAGNDLKNWKAAIEDLMK